MNEFCYVSEELDRIPAKQWGGKARGLRLLQTNWCNVPAFVVIPPKKIVDIAKHDIYESVAQEVIKLLHAKRYIIRSNALIEDAQESSHAGQFMSKGNIFEANIAEALQEVIRHAKTYLNGKLSSFSIIIQEYIDPDISGVLFTRSPDGGREFVLEYHEGAGELLVSGAVTPKTIKAYWQEHTPIKLPNWEGMKKTFRVLEDTAGHPQDIEWCIKDGVWYVVQSRPITTITTDQYEKIISLESTLPRDTDYRYVKNDITDIVGVPYPLAMSLFEYIYGDTGPVAQAYRIHRIQYKDTDFFTLLGKSLYIDNVKEIKTLLPSYIVNIQTGKQSFKLQSGVIRTIRNLVKLSVLNVKSRPIVQNFSTHVRRVEHISTIEEWIERFTVAYQDVFNANLCASTSLGYLKILLKKESVSVLDVLRGSSELDEEYTELQKELPRLTGNGLDISDTSTFSIGPLKNYAKNDVVATWLDTLSVGKKKYLERKINAAREGERIREMGRWITIVYISKLRELAKGADLSRDEYLFVTLDELATGAIDHAVIAERKKVFNNLPEYTDTLITSVYAEKNIEKGMGVSEGIGKGVLLNMSSIEKFSEKNIILLVDTLSPSLTEYFDRIQGICAKRGGMLSHLAIIARERKMPVIIHSEVDSTLVGTMVQIDGKTGEIEMV